MAAAGGPRMPRSSSSIWTPTARCAALLGGANRQDRTAGKGHTLPVPAPTEHVRTTSVSCRNRCGAANGEFVPL
jgi:hypothetical protein